MCNLNGSYIIVSFINIIFLLCALHCLILFAKGSAQKLRSPAPDFNKHRLVQPVVHHARTKREITSTRDTVGAHHTAVTMKVPLDDRELILDLQLNKDLITDNHVLRYQKEGKTVSHKPKKEDIDLCQYSGTVRDMPGSWVAVSTCHGVRGVIFDGEQMRYIESAGGDDIQSQHYMYDHSELNSTHRRGYIGDIYSTGPTGRHSPRVKEHHVDRQQNRHKRSTDVHEPYNANKNSRYVELVMVADNRVYVKNGRDLRVVYRKMMDLANIMNSVYAPLNIFIALVGVEVWTHRDMIEISRNSGLTLDKFLKYRHDELRLPNDNAHLLTLQEFDEGVIGKGYKGSMCMYKSGGIDSDHSSVVGLVAMTIAHELGHNFGMDHDNDEDCECPNRNGCIMAPYSAPETATGWSTCSQAALIQSFELGLDHCLRNEPKRLFDSPTCGNGFVEPGEQCDCGSSADGRSNPCHACCQPETCMLRRNATCGAGVCCDLQTCRPRAAGTACRAAERECDLPEYCTGHSEFCPDDVYKMDTTPCGKDNHRAYCVSGRCHSHASQCQLMWGPTGQPSHNECYATRNIQGIQSGNCGYDERWRQYRRCPQQDALCGTLHCQHLARDPAFGKEHTRIHYTVFAENSVKNCHSIVFGKDQSNNLGLVPDGAVCGHQMMCKQQRCESAEAVRATIAANDCPSNCSGHGVCNSEGHCHCDIGFAPPLCALPGTGGSLDSGPASNYPTSKTFSINIVLSDTTGEIMKYVMVAIYVIFLGIIPAAFLIFLIFYYRRNLKLWWNYGGPRRSYHDLLCGGCCTNTNIKQTIVNSFQNTTSSMRQLLIFKSKTENADRNPKTVDATKRVSKITIETKINVVTKTDGNPANKLTIPVTPINKDNILKMNSSTNINDEAIYANVQNKTNTRLDINQKTIRTPIKTIYKNDTHIYGNVSTSKISKQSNNISHDIHKPLISKDVQLCSNIVMNTKKNTKVYSPIKKINNSDTQIVNGLVKGPLAQVKLRPATKPVLSKGNRPTGNNGESNTQETVANIRRMFDTGNASK